MSYDDILIEIENANLEVWEDDTPGSLKGFYIDGCIVVNKSLDEWDKKCVLAEEYAHYRLNAGDILDLTQPNNRRQEKKARAMVYEMLAPIERIAEACHRGCGNDFEIAEYLQVPETFLREAIAFYHEKYGEPALRAMIMRFTKNRSLIKHG